MIFSCSPKASFSVRDCNLFCFLLRISGFEQCKVQAAVNTGLSPNATLGLKDLPQLQSVLQAGGPQLSAELITKWVAPSAR